MSDCDIIMLARKEVERVFTTKNPQGLGSRDSIVPIMCISKDGKVVFKNTDRHPASNRCPGIAHFVQNILFKECTKDDIKRYAGEYRFEPHDAIQDSRDEMTLCFARNMVDPSLSRNAILFPDYYHMFGYDGLLEKSPADEIAWSDKNPQVLFAGTTTGPTDPAKNKRVQACIWALRDPAKYDFKLTSVCQMKYDDIVNHCGVETARRIIGRFVNPQEHREYRYVMNIEGNTCCWSRLPMIMSTRTLLLNLVHDEGNWYYPLLKHNETHLDVKTLDDIENTLKFCESNPLKCQTMTAAARAIVSRVCTQRAAVLYAKAILDAIVRFRSRL